MTKDNNRKVLRLAAAALVGGVMGAIVFDDSSKVSKLEDEVNRLRQSEAYAQSRLRDLSKFAPTVRTSLAPPSTRVTPTNAVTVLSHSDRQRNEFLGKKAADREAEYSRVFEELHVDPQRGDELKTMLTTIDYKAYDTLMSMQDLMELRLKYREELAHSMSSNDYNSYLEYEQSSRAAREADRFFTLVWERDGVALDKGYQQEIIDLFYNTEAYSIATERWHGPFDPVPRPAVGTEMATQRAEEEIDRLSRQQGAFMEQLESSQLPGDQKQFLKQYFEGNVQQLRSDLEFLKKSPEEMFGE